MYRLVTLNSFRDAFEKAGCKDQFSYAGQGALFNHIGEQEGDCGVLGELDALAFCCEYVESTIEDALAETGMESIEKLRENTTVIEVGKTDRIIYQDF